MCNTFQVCVSEIMFIFFSFFVIFFVYCALDMHYQLDVLNHRSFKVIKYLNDKLVVNYRVGNAY